MTTLMHSTGGSGIAPHSARDEQPNLRGKSPINLICLRSML